MENQPLSSCPRSWRLHLLEKNDPNGIESVTLNVAAEMGTREFKTSSGCDGFRLTSGEEAGWCWEKQTEVDSIVNSGADTSSSVPGGVGFPKCLRLWVDGGGVILVCLQDQIRIGRSGGEGELQFMAPLGSTHVTLFGTGESHVLVPRQRVSIGEKEVVGPTLLRDGETIEMLSDLQIQFRLPSPLSRTAVLSFPGKIPPTPTFDAAILMNRTCLIGQGPQNHIVVPGIDERGVLIWNGQELVCRFSENHDEEQFGSSWGITNRVAVGSVTSGKQLRFRCESYVVD